MTSPRLPRATTRSTFRFVPALIVAAIFVVAVFGASAANFSFFERVANNEVAPQKAGLPGQTAAGISYASLMNSLKPLAATVTTDKQDYPPGSTVVISGSGWTPGETVALQITEDDGDPPWDSSAVADGSGNISNSSFVIQTHDLGVTFVLTATGAESGQTASTSFTDGLVNPDQGANGGFGDPPTNPVEWINGNVQKEKGHFVEGQSTIYRADITGLTPGQPARFLVFFEITKGTKHALDFITGPRRIAEAVQPTDGLEATFGAFPGTRTTFPIPLPPASAPLTRSYASAQQTADAAAGKAIDANNMWMWNGTITSIHYSSSTTVTGTDTWAPELGSDQATYAEITFTPAAGKSEVLLAWGGHIAKEDDWGVGNGATAIPGSPYHMHMARICTDASTADSACTTIGNQDLQLAAAAVCNPPVATDPIDQSVCKGGTAVFSTTATGSGTLSFQWKIDGVNTSTGVTSTATTSSISINTAGLSAGNHDVCVTVTSNSSCGSPGDTECAILSVNQVSVSSTKTDVSCNGGTDGSMTVTISGGTAPYTCSKDGGAFAPCASGDVFGGLAAGSHTLDVKDTNNCPGTTSQTIGQPAALVVSSTKTDVSCNGGTDGSMTVTISGGTSPYTCSKDGGAFAPCASGDVFGGLAAGSHTIDVKDAHNCPGSTSKTIGQPDALVVSSTKTDVSCNGGSDGSMTVTISGGTSPYTCSKDGGAFAPCASGDVFGGLAAGSHTIDVKDAHNCPGSTSKTIGQADALVVSSTKTDVSCNGGTDGSMTVTISGGTSPYTCSKDGGAFAACTSGQVFGGLAAGSHTIDVKDAHNCPGSTSKTIGQPDALVVSSTKTDVSCNGGTDGSMTVTISGGTSPYTCSKDGGAFAPCASGDVFGGLAAGSHTIDVKDAHNCPGSTSKTIGQPDALVVSSTKTDVTCNGAANGSITVTITGGTSPYTCSKDGGAFAACTSGQVFGSLAPGSHTIDVKDAHNCPGSTSKTIGQPDALTVSLSEPSCANGGNTAQITATANGGNGGNSFAWSIIGGSFVDAACVPGPTCTSLTNGPTVTYTTSSGQVKISVTVTDVNACTASDDVDFSCSTPHLLCTLTQGAYGNKKGQFQLGDTKLNRLDLITLLLGPGYGDLSLGVFGERSLKILGLGSSVDSAQCIILRMPAGTTPFQLYDSASSPIDEILSTASCQTSPVALPLNNKGRWANVFLGQTLTLSLNIRLSAANSVGNPPSEDLGSLQLCKFMAAKRVSSSGLPDSAPECGGNVKTTVFSDAILAALDANGDHTRTVSNLLTLANKALAGEDNHGELGASIEEISDAVTAVNELFDECRYEIYCDNNTAPTYPPCP